MANLKHVGRLKSNQRKVVVAYRVVPNEPESCLVVDSATLGPSDHDSLMTLVESNAGQSSYELATAMARTQLTDGRNMLTAFHATGRLQKVPTDAVEMTPNLQTAVLLSEVNAAIAEQKGVTVAELALSEGGDEPQNKPATQEPTKVEEVATINEVPTSNVAAEAQAARIQAPDDGVLTDEQLAASYRSQADRLFKEAKVLREQAEELVPTKKKSSAKKTETA